MTTVETFRYHLHLPKFENKRRTHFFFNIKRDAFYHWKHSLLTHLKADLGKPTNDKITSLRRATLNLLCSSRKQGKPVIKCVTFKFYHNHAWCHKNEIELMRPRLSNDIQQLLHLTNKTCFSWQCLTTNYG